MIFAGAMTAIVTPMRDGAPDNDALTRLVNDQIAAGIDALVAVGTTGESATLDHREQLQVIKHVVQSAAGRVPVIAGAGTCATQGAIALSKAAQDAGADGLLHVTPYYNKPTQEGLYRHFSAIAAATTLPVVLYNVPGRTSCDLLPETVQRLAEIETIVAIKDATADMRRAHDLIALVGDQLAILSGDDPTAFPMFCLGGHGVISVISNVMPDRMATMWRASQEGDYATARQAHYSMIPLMRLLALETNPIPVKAAMELLGKCGPDIRLPLVPCSNPVREKIRACLEAEGLL